MKIPIQEWWRSLWNEPKSPVTDFANTSEHTPMEPALIYGDAEMTQNLKRLISSYEKANVEMAFQLLKGNDHESVRHLPENLPFESKYIWLVAWFQLPPPSHGYFTLKLNHCNLEKLPATMGHCLSYIITLDLADNQLETLPDSIYQADTRNRYRTFTLNLSRNRFQEFSEKLWLCDGLTELSLKENQIPLVPDLANPLPSLKILALSNNQIAWLPENIHLLPNLQSLEVQNNQLEYLPASLARCRQLIQLNLSSNQFSTFPKSLLDCASLKSISFYNNRLTYLPDLYNPWPELEELNLSYNQLDVLCMVELPKLRRLFVANNALSQLMFPAESLPQLEKLHLHSNRLQTLPETIGTLKKLRELRLYSNQLISLPESIGNLEKLRYLSLEKNQLTTLPDSIQNLKQLKQLDLLGNPISESEKTRIQSLLPHVQIRF